MKPEKSTPPKQITEWSEAIHLTLKHYVPLIVFIATGDISQGIGCGILLGNFSLKEVVEAFKGKNLQ